MKIIRNGLTAAMLIILVSGCSNLWGGVAGGAIGTSAGYELRARQQMKKLDEDLKAGRIDQNEYDIRKSQIERGSIVY